MSNRRQRLGRFAACLLAVAAVLCAVAALFAPAVAAETTVRIDGSPPAYFPSLQAAIDNTRPGDVIQARATGFGEHLVYNRDCKIALLGGYNSGFASNTGRSVVKGDLRISAGTLRIKNLAISADVTAPSVLSVSPMPGSFGIPVNCVISVAFDETIKAASISPGAISVKDGQNKAVPGTLSTFGRTASFTPSSTLDVSTDYFVTVAPGVRDLAGNATTGGSSWQFQTTYLPHPFDFSLTPASSQFNSWREEMNRMTIDLAVTSSTPFPVTLSIEGCPPAAVCMASPNQVFSYVAIARQYVSLLISASTATPLRTFPVTLRGDGGGVYRTATIAVKVGPPRSLIRPTELWGADGTPVTTAPGQQLGVVAASDGDGGAIFLWEEDVVTFGRPDIYGQRISRSGNPLWASNGNPLIAAPNDLNEPASQRNIAAMADGDGGVLFTWEDDRRRQIDIFLQRIRDTGISAWAQDGIPVSTACWLPGEPCANHKRNPQIAQDNAGGAIVTWYETRDGFHSSVWAQRISAGGIPVWQLDGVPVAYGDFNADFARIISDGAGGAIIVWQDGRNSTYRYRAQRLDAAGAPLWAVNGLQVPGPALADRSLQGFALSADGAGGVILTWVGASGDHTSDLYAQRIDAAGNMVWNAAGVSVCRRSSYQCSLTMVTDGAGGAIIAWEDLGAAPSGTGQQWIYAQRVNSQGTALWQADGIPLHTFQSMGPQAVSDDAGGAIIVWDGFRVAGPNELNPAIYAQHITGDGRILWTPGGYQMFTIAGSNHMGPEAISDGWGGAIIHWGDYRLTSGATQDLFTQRLTDNAP